MAQKNRANMLTDITTNIFNNVINYITGQNAQDRFVNLLDSAPNILSDKDQANGYVGLDAVGNMFSSYYNENISRANLVTLLTSSTAVGYKYYQIYDADGANYRTLLVMADSNITLYPWAIDLNTSEVGTYNITTDTFVSTLGGIVTTTEAALAALETAGTLSTTVLYMVTDSSPYKLLCKAETASQLSRTATVVDAVYSGTVNYDLQNNTMTVVALSDNGGDPNQYFGVTPTVLLAPSSYGNIFYINSGASLGNGCSYNTFEQKASNNTLGDSCALNTFKQYSNDFIFADYLQNVTIEAGTTGADYTASPTYDFLYNNSYPATIFSDGTDNYHRYYEPTNDRIVLTNLTTLAVSYIGGGGGGGLLSGTATQVSAGTYTATISGAGTYTTGDTYVITFTTANDGASTININGQGAINIFKNTSIPISSGDIKANQTVIIVYDGTNFQAIGLVSSQLLAYVHNAEASAITKGQVVYAFGASGNKMSVKLAKADADATSAKTIGMVYDTSIAAGGEGYIIIQGVIEGLNTAAYTAGDTLYLSGATAGDVTNVKQYAPTHLVYVGIVERANAGNGQIYVRIQNGYELDELHDVSAQTPIDGDTLIYNSTSGLWEAKALKVSENTNGTAVTGTTANTLSKSLLVPANTLKAGSVVIFIARAAKTGNAGTIQLRLYWNTTASLTGAILLATTAANASSSVFSQMSRWIPVEVANGTGNGTRMFTPTTFAATDFGVSTAAISTLALDWTVDSYLICAIQNGAAGDSSVCNVLSIT